MADLENHNSFVPKEAQEKAEHELNSVIQDTDSEDLEEEIVVLDKRIREHEAFKDKQKPEQPKTKVVKVAEAVSSAPVFSPHSDRSEIRLLILTRDTAIFRENSTVQKKTLQLSDMFGEIHIVVLTTRAEASHTKERLTDNVWIYPTNSTYWWKAGFDAYRIANEQLYFGQGFRADIIIAEDPFEAGVVAYYLSEKHQRPFQVHILSDFFGGHFARKDRHNKWRLFMARFVMQRTDCVRTNTDFLQGRIIEQYPELSDYTEILPVFHDLSAWRGATPEFSLTDRYPQFKFVLLHISTMEPPSHSDRILTGAIPVLKEYPSVGLVIVGDGPERAALEKQVLTFGLQNKVVFEPKADDIISHMKTADLLLHISEDPEEDIIIIQAAAVGLPMLLSVSGIGGELFIDGMSAFICPNDSPPCFTQKIKRFVNENSLRAQLSRNAEDIVFSRVEQDYGVYLRAYRSSIERCITLES